MKYTIGKARSSWRAMNYKWALILVSILWIGLTGCQDEDAKKGKGYVSLQMQADTTYPTTKAGDPENVNEYTIQILQRGEVITKFLYSERPESLTLDAGEYTAKAIWGDKVAADFEALYMEGSTNFTVKADYTTQVNLTPTPANAKVIVNYAKELAEVYSDYSIEMTTSHTTTPLIYAKSETRPAYFVADATGETLDLALLFKTSTKEYQFDKSFTINPRDFLTLKVSLGEGSTATQDPIIKTDWVGLVYPGDTVISQDVKVTTNCNDFTVFTAATWLTVTKGAGKITIAPTGKNYTGGYRLGSVVLTAVSGNKTAMATVNVMQYPYSETGTGDLLIQVLPEQITGDRFENYTVQVVTNSSSWDFEQQSSSQAWMTVEKVNNSLVINSTAFNEGEGPRETYVEVKTTSGSSVARDTLYITQNVRLDNPAISAKWRGNEITDGITIAKEGSQETIEVLTNIDDWEAILSAGADSWLDMVKENDQLLLSTSFNNEDRNRSAIITLKAANANNQEATCQVVVTQSGSYSENPKLILTIEINKEFIGEETLTGYLVDDPAAGVTTPEIFTSGFADKQPFTIKAGKSASKFVNIRVPQGIASCTLNSMDMLNAGNSTGSFCSMNTEGTLGVIYLDNYLNSLSNGSHVFDLTVKDLVDNTVSIMGIVTVEN